MKTLLTLLLLLSVARSLIGQQPSLEMADSLHQTGVMHFQQGDLQRAIGDFSASLELKKQLLPPLDISIRKTANNITIAYRRMGDFWQAIPYRRLTIQVQRNSEGEVNPRMANYYNDLGTSFFSLSLLDSALYYFKKSENLYEQLIAANKLEPAMVSGPWNNMALFYLETGDFDRAEEYLLKVKPFWEDPASDGSIELLEYNFGDLYRKKGDYQRALLQFRKALDGWQKDTTLNGRTWTANCLERIGFTLQEAGDHDQAISYLVQTQALRESVFPAHSPRLIFGYHNLGIALRNAGKLEEAKKYLLQVYQFYLEAPVLDSLSLGSSLRELGYLYQDMHQPAVAERYVRQAIEIQRTYLTPDAVKIGEGYIQLANILLSQDKLDEALKVIQTGVEHFTRKGQVLKDDFSKMEPSAPLFNAIGVRAAIKAQMGIRNDDTRLLKQALEDFQLQNRLANHLRVNYHLQDEKLRVLAGMRNSYEGALKVTALLFQKEAKEEYLALALQFMEQSKSILLFEDWQKRMASLSGKLDPSLSKREIVLRKTLSKINIALQTYTDQQSDEYRKHLRESYDVHLGYYYALLDNIQQNSPELYAEMYEPALAELKELRDYARQTERSVIQYFLGREHLFFLVVNQDDATFVYRKINTDLDSLIRNFRNSIVEYHYARENGESNPMLGRRALNDYIQTGNLLYNKLIVPVGEELKERLTIIPDGELEHLPFEALLTGPVPRLNSIHAYPFLINNHQISYAYSGTMLIRSGFNAPKSAAPKQEILVMAPFTNQGYEYVSKRSAGTPADTLVLAPLQNSIMEAEAVLHSWPGEVILDSLATLDRFELLAPAYNLLHLATHGVISPAKSDLSFLAFAASRFAEGHLLFAQNIYNLDLQAELVFLSACQTGSGSVQAGEGIMSLSRAFTFAGARSLVGTLWKVADDPELVGITENFYELLQQGLTKDEALRKAKLAYLNDPEHRGELSLPFFWAAFVPYGEMAPVR